MNSVVKFRFSSLDHLLSGEKWPTISYKMVHYRTHTPTLNSFVFRFHYENVSVFVCVEFAIFFPFKQNYILQGDIHISFVVMCQ